MGQLKINKQIGGIVLSLSGDFTGGDETEKLRTQIKELAESDASKLIIDLGKTTYLNSSALGALISGHSSFLKKEGQIVLCNVSKSLENIFVITKLTLVFDIVDTLDDAIAKLSK